MQTRTFGRTGHQSTVAIFGAFAFSECSQKEADAGMELLLEAGVNHMDVAPSYGEAELRLGPWMLRVRTQFFLGCKTMERSAQGARAELQRSLERLQVDSFDLYQIHAVTKWSDLDDATRPGGALEGILRAREEGLTRYVGITGHGMQAPEIFIEALNRYDFDSILFPMNFVLFADPGYRRGALELLRLCRERNVGVMIIKAAAARLWNEGEAHIHNTWYRALEDPQVIQKAVNFALSHDVTGICTPGDLTVLPHVLSACEHFTDMGQEEAEALMAQAGEYGNVFPPERV